MSISTWVQPVHLPVAEDCRWTTTTVTVRRVLVFGHLGVGNIGDEAMLPGVLGAIRERWPTAEVVIATGERGSSPDGMPGRIAFIPRTLPSLLRALWRSDAFVVAGGTHLASFHQSRRHTAGILRHLVLYRLAKMLGLRVYLAGVGLGPFETRVGAALARFALAAADYISVRDQASLDLLARIGVASSRCGACDDPARGLQLPPRRLAGPHLGVSVMQYFRYYTDEPNGDHRLEHRICELLKEWFERHRDSRVSLVGFYSADGQRDDIAIARRIAARMDDDRVTVVDPAGRLDVCLEAFRGFSHFVSTRYHSQVLASMFGIPQVTIVYHQKNRMFASEVGMPANRLVNIHDFARGEGQMAFQALLDEPVGSEYTRGDSNVDENLRRLFPRETAA